MVLKNQRTACETTSIILHRPKNAVDRLLVGLQVIGGIVLAGTALRQPFFGMETCLKPEDHCDITGTELAGPVIIRQKLIACVRIKAWVLPPEILFDLGW